MYASTSNDTGHLALSCNTKWHPGVELPLTPDIIVHLSFHPRILQSARKAINKLLALSHVSLMTSLLAGRYSRLVSLSSQGRYGHDSIISITGFQQNLGNEIP